MRLYLERFEHAGIHEYVVFDGIEEAIRALAADGRRMAVVTAKNEPHARRLVASLPFGHLFEDVIGATLDGRLSHKPELIGEALRRFGLGPEACTMIGDRHLDIEGARHHGMHGVGIAWGFGSVGELRDAGADAIALQPCDLAQLLRNRATA